MVAGWWCLHGRGVRMDKGGVSRERTTSIWGGVAVVQTDLNRTGVCFRGRASMSVWRSEGMSQHIFRLNPRMSTWANE